MISEEFSPEEIAKAIGRIELRAMVNWEYREAVMPMLEALINELRR